MLKQNQYVPLPEPFEIISIWAVTNGFLDDIEIEKITQFEKDLHQFIGRNYQKLITTLENGEKLSESVVETLEKALKEFKKINN